MENLFHICLRAVSEDRRIDREYVMEMGVDLFKRWYVTTTYGRSFTKGRKATADFQTKQEACVFIDDMLRRRLSAPKRIGYAYQITSLTSHHLFNERFLDANLIAKFNLEN